MKTFKATHLFRGARVVLIEEYWSREGHLPFDIRAPECHGVSLPFGVYTYQDWFAHAKGDEALREIAFQASHKFYEVLRDPLRPGKIREKLKEASRILNEYTHSGFVFYEGAHPPRVRASQEGCLAERADTLSFEWIEDKLVPLSEDNFKPTHRLSGGPVMLLDEGDWYEIWDHGVQYLLPIGVYSLREWVEGWQPRLRLTRDGLLFSYNLDSGFWSPRGWANLEPPLTKKSSHNESQEQIETTSQPA